MQMGDRPRAEVQMGDTNGGQTLKLFMKFPKKGYERRPHMVYNQSSFRKTCMRERVGFLWKKKRN